MFNLDSKCANPACATRFDWQQHGKFYRFFRDAASVNKYNLSPHSFPGPRALEHFWLCEACSGSFILAYDQERGIELRPREFARRSAECEELTAA